MFFVKRPFLSVFILLLLFIYFINIDWKQKNNFEYEDITPIFLINNFSVDSLKTGDLVLRSGTGVYSWLNKNIFCKSDKYSHCGIISVEGDSVFVYHALGGRESVTNELRKTELLHYSNKKATSGIAFYRYNLNQQQREHAFDLMKILYNEKVLFDHAFDLQSKDKLYHTEFVYHVINTVLNKDQLFNVSSFLGKDYIGIDDLYNNQIATLVAAFEYE